MALIPEDSDNLVTIGEYVEIDAIEGQTSITYKMDLESGRIRGLIEGAEAVKQMISKILQTKRFAHLIYSWNYGNELHTLIGKSNIVLQSELKRLITEALIADDRVSEVTNFVIQTLDKRSVVVEFTVVSMYGELSISEEVQI